MPHNSTYNKPIIFFDGYCGLCNSSIDRLMQMDKNAVFFFSPLQGLTAEKLGLSPGQADPDSIILFSKGVFYHRSTAVLKALWMLGGFPALASIFFLVPTFLRDVVYKWIARNRYRWFGRKESCRIPNADERSRFLE